MPHDLLIAKLNAYGFDSTAIRLIHNYLSGRRQRTKVGNSFSSWKDILFGVPQGSILGPILFNIFLCDLFFIIDEVDFASFADDTTPYAEGESIEDVIKSLEKVSLKLFDWFELNQMKANPDKCSLIVNSNESVILNIDNNNIIQSKPSVKLLGVKIDHKLKFDEHVKSICKNANRKLHALARVSPYMDIQKKKILFNAFFYSQFSYCPLAWMCHSRELNNMINSLHEKSLRIIHYDKKSSFQELLEKDNAVSIHERNLKRLCIEMHKVVYGSAPEIFSNLFCIKDDPNYNLRSSDYFKVPKTKSVLNGDETISVLGPKIWNALPDKLKAIESLQSFQVAIKKIKIDFCPCKLDKQYIAGVGYI